MCQGAGKSRILLPADVGKSGPMPTARVRLGTAGSEREFGSQLDVARGQSITADRAEGGRVESRIRSSKMRRVKQVEHICLELQLAMLRPQRSGLGQGEVPVIDSGRADVADAGVAERIRSRIGEAASVEPLINGLRLADALADNVCLVRASVVIEQRRGDVDREWRTRLERIDAARRPSADDVADHAG